jgi:hypothetical protein
MVVGLAQQALIDARLPRYSKPVIESGGVYYAASW